MKNTTLIIALLLSSFVYGQNVFRLDSTKTFIANVADNSQWDAQFRSYYEYANGGKKDTQMLQQILATANWENLLRSLKSYNDNNEIILNQFQAWDPVKMIWVNSGSIEFLYNEDNLLETKNEYNIIGLLAVEEFAYDAMANVIEEVYKMADPMTFAITNEERRTHQYAGSNVIEDIFQDWTDTGWLYRERREYMYDGPNGFVSSIEKQEWDSDDWANILELNTFIYNDDNLVEEVLVETNTENGFQYYKRTLNTYDSESNLTQLTGQTWSGTSWDNESNLLQDYDSDNNIEEQISQIWDVNSADWLNQVRLLSYWSPAENLSVTFHEAIAIEIYPNPTSNFIEIDLKQSLPRGVRATLYDVLGKLITTKNIPDGLSSFRMPLVNQAYGVYILKIESNFGEQTFRIVKSKN